MRNLFTFRGGVKVAGHKALSNQLPITPATLAPEYILPLLQHIGSIPEPVVHIGERVLKGQVIASCGGACDSFTGAPVHAPTSGTITAIERRAVPHPSGLTATCIILAADGKEEWIPLQPIHYTDYSPSELRQHIARAGIVGLGGAGFPTHLKMQPHIQTLILNGAECEPYITCDDRLMQAHAEDIIHGLNIISYILGTVSRRIIAVEDNKPEAITALKTAVTRLQETLEIITIPTLYPTGGERQLIRVLLGKEIGRKQLPSQSGIVVHNVETARAVYRAIYEGKPLISRVVTLTGDGINRPCNLETLMGTPIHHLLTQCDAKPDIQHLIMGGSMMGFALTTTDLPIIKTTNCLIASLHPPPPQTTLPCIRCGTCAEACPMNLLPQQLYWHARAKDFKKAEQYHLFDCIDCGCCAVVCPSHIPLVDYFRYAKTEIRTAQHEKHQADIARHRHETRQIRLEREQAEQALRHQQKKQGFNK